MSELQKRIALQSQAAQHHENKPLQNERRSMHPTLHSKHIPTYLDEFKHGFPSTGLSSASRRWWGSEGFSDESQRNSEEHSPTETSNFTQKCLVDGPSASSKTIDVTKIEANKGKTGIDGALLLSSIRKRNAVQGREVVTHGVTRGYGAEKLGKPEKALLMRIFGSSLPDQWRYSFS